MGQNVSGLEGLVAEFRPELPAQSRTAQAIDQQDPFEQIVYRAIDDGYVEFADELGRFMEIYLRRST